MLLSILSSSLYTVSYPSHFLRSFPTRRSSDLLDARAITPAPMRKHTLRMMMRRIIAGSLSWPEHTSTRSEEHTSELQSPCNLVYRRLLEKKNSIIKDGYSVKFVTFKGWLN